MADFDLAAMPELERRVICGQHPTLQHQHDDASKAWDEAKSAYLTVARLDVPKQEIWSETPRQAVDDGMAFSPWNGLAAHQPVGSIMRTRRLAYPASANFRLEKKGRPFSRWPFWSFRDWIGESNAAANQW